MTREADLSLNSLRSRLGRALDDRRRGHLLLPELLAGLDVFALHLGVEDQRGPFGDGSEWEGGICAKCFFSCGGDFFTGAYLWIVALNSRLPFIWNHRKLL